MQGDAGMSSGGGGEEIIEKMLESADSKSAQKDAKVRWIARMMRSAKLKYKVCPYFDRKKKICFLNLGAKCPYEGRYDNCQVFVAFLEKRYNEIVSAGKPLPADFDDPLVQFGVL